MGLSLKYKYNLSEFFTFDKQKVFCIDSSNKFKYHSKKAYLEVNNFYYCVNLRNIFTK